MSFGINLALLIGPTVPVPAPLPLIDALQSVEVTNTDEGRDGFQITFTAGRSGLADILDYPLMTNPLLTPFNRVIIMVTVGVVPKVLIDGIITHIQLNPSNEPGQSTLTITGEDVGVTMDIEEKSETYPNQPDIVIVNRIIASYAKYGLVPMVMPPPAMDIPLIIDRIPSQHGTDLSYITELAKSHGFVFYIEPQLPGVNTAYWGPLNLTGIPQKALSINMGPETTNVNSINFQYNALTPIMVDGSIQDRMINEVIPVKTFATTRTPLASQPAWLINQPNVRTKQFRESGLNTIQAFDRAQAETDKSMDVLVATGEIDSLRYGDVLQARKLVGLRGAGIAHDGFYYVKKVTHTIKVGEYKQSFTLVREGFGSITPVVPP